MASFHCFSKVFELLSSSARAAAVAGVRRLKTAIRGKRAPAIVCCAHSTDECKCFSVTGRDTFFISSDGDEQKRKSSVLWRTHIVVDGGEHNFSFRGEAEITVQNHYHLHALVSHHFQSFLRPFYAFHLLSTADAEREEWRGEALSATIKASGISGPVKSSLANGRS